MRGHGSILTQSSDGEIHFIVNELEADASINDSDLSETKIRKIMRTEAEKPLHLRREYE